MSASSGQTRASASRVRCGWAASSKAERRTPSWLIARPCGGERGRRGCGRLQHRPARFQARGLGAGKAARAGADAAERDALFGQPLVGVVGAQRQPVFGARGEHAIGLADAAGDEIVDHHPEIGFGAVEARGAAPAGLARGVDPGDQALRGRLLVAGRAVDLAGEDRARRRGASPGWRRARADRCSRIRSRSRAGRCARFRAQEWSRRSAACVSAGSEVEMPFG